MLLQLSIFSIKAQVTIGTTKAPVAGALLDLKGDDKLGANSVKGLLLPRVNLKEVDKLIMSDFEVDPSEYLDHTGLTVYNLIELKTPSSPDRCKWTIWTTQLAIGINVWDGKKWNYVGEPEGESPPPEIDGVEILIDIEGNDYLTMDFGIAGRWMTQSLRSKTFDTESGINRTFPVNPGSGPNAEVHWGYPNLNDKSVTDDEFYKSNKAVGLLYMHQQYLGPIRQLKKLKEYAPMDGMCPPMQSMRY